MPSKASSSTVCRRQRRRPNHSQRRTPAREPAEPGSLSLDGAADSRWLKRKQKNAMSGRQTKRRGASPFDGALSDDNRRQKNNGASDRKKPTASSAQSIVANGKDFKSKKFAAGAGAARPNSVTYEVDENAYPTGPLLPFATSIYDQLRSDGIYPPKWPNSLSNTVAMGKLREDHKVYRDRARDSLIRANLVDAPGVQKRLEDALVFKGVCENMCPEMEMITRIIEPDIPSVEKDPATSFVERRKMIKKLARSAAGQETPLPMDVLSVASMRRTLNYLIDNLLRTDENLPIVHGYLWDRTRALRRDFTFHSEMCAEELTDQVYCYENIIRFHVTALHLLSRKNVRPEEFSEQQELEQLSKTLMSLMSTYETCEAKNVICENESEFRAYYGLFFASSPDIQSSFQRGARSLQAWKDSDVIRTAVSLIEALQNTTSMHGPLGNSPSHAALGMHSVYFRILESPEVSYTMACFAEIHFGTLRRSILQQAKKAYRRPKILSKDPTPSLLNSFLRFDTDEEAVEFIEMHGLDFLPNEDAPRDPSRRYLDVTKHLNQPRIPHAYSSSLVEKKRGNRSLPTVIHETTFEDPSAQAAAKFSNDESLFVSDNSGHNHPSASTLASNGTGAAIDSSNHSKASPFPEGSPFRNPLPGSSSGALSTPHNNNNNNNNNPFSSGPSSAATATPQSTAASPFGQPSKPAANPSPFGQPTRSPSPFSQQPVTSTQPSGFGVPRATSPFSQPNGQASTTATKSPFGQPASASGFGQPATATPSTASPFGQQNNTTSTASPFGNPATANGSKLAANASPFGQGSSFGKPQDAPTSFKSPFSAGTTAPGSASSPPTTSVPASSPFGSGAVKPTEPNPAETKSVFGATTSVPAPTVNNASPFSGLMGATKPPPFQQVPATNSATKPSSLPEPPQPKPATSSSGTFQNPAAPSLPQNAPPSAKGPPSFPSSGLLGTDTTNNMASTAPTFKVTPPTPTFPLKPASTTAAATAPPTTLTFPPQAEPSMTLKATNTVTVAPMSTQATEPMQPVPSLGTTFAPAPPAAQMPPPPPPPQPARDLLGDFTKWMVLGDGGLLQEFQDYIVEDLVKKTFDQFVQTEKERKRQEEEAIDLAEARKFQVHNLSVKFFYRWRDTARRLRLRRRRANDKAERKAYMAAKRAEVIEAEKKAKKRAEAEKRALERGDPVSEFRDFLNSKSEYEDALLASGILTGVVDEQHAANSIVRNDFKIPRLPDRSGSKRQSLPNGDPADHGASGRSSPVGGAKTRALREQLHGGSKSISGTSSFRRSLPPGSKPMQSWRASPSTSDSGKRISKVSDRWRLKAMGLVTMPDGTALPEQLANSMRYDGKRYDGWGSFGLDGPNAHRRSRSTSTDLAHSTAVRNAFVESFRKSGSTAASTTPRETSPSSTKRKRDLDDEVAKNGSRAKKLATGGDEGIERILREAAELRGSLRSTRVDLAESTGWFKEQSEMLQQDEMLSRRSSSNWGRE